MFCFAYHPGRAPGKEGRHISGGDARFIEWLLAQISRVLRRGNRMMSYHFIRLTLYNRPQRAAPVKAGSAKPGAAIEPAPMGCSPPAGMPPFRDSSERQFETQKSALAALGEIATR